MRVFYTPANVALDEAVDLDPALTEPEQEAVFAAGLNLLRCSPGRGLQVWGGRTLDPAHLYVAHRRLLHRLVRAIHRVADPLVFDVNGPDLRLSLVRAVTFTASSAFGNTPCSSATAPTCSVRCRLHSVRRLSGATSKCRPWMARSNTR